MHDWCRVPLITQFHGAFQDAYQIFLVMEYCGGGDLLERLLKEGRAMSERRVILEVAVPLLKTLQHMHSYSIIHRWRHVFPASHTSSTASARDAASREVVGGSTLAQAQICKLCARVVRD